MNQILVNALLEGNAEVFNKNRPAFFENDDVFDCLVINKDLAGFNLAGVQFQFISFEDMNFNGTNLSDAFGEHCFFTNVSFNATEMLRGHWAHCSYQNTSFAGADVSGTKFFKPVNNILDITGAIGEATVYLENTEQQLIAA